MQARPALTGPGLQLTAMPRPDLPFNGRHPSDPCNYMDNYSFTNPGEMEGLVGLEMCVNNLPKVTLNSTAAGIEPVISNRKSNTLTTTPLSNNIIPCVNISQFLHIFHLLECLQREKRQMIIFRATAKYTNISTGESLLRTTG